MSDLLIRNIGLLATPLCQDQKDARRPVHTTSRAAILIRDGRVVMSGPESEIVVKAPRNIRSYDAGGALATPGLVDCHTHPVYVGNRATEFHLRNAGKSYLEIAAAGGGIVASARKVMDAGMDQIVAESLPRFRRSLMGGVATIEAKSGYGLDWNSEQKLLNAINQIRSQIPQRVHRTFLIHALPESATINREGFVASVLQQMIPGVAGHGLADSVDVFCESGAFTVEETQQFLNAARSAGLRTMVHANQFGHSGGAMLAAEIQAESASHLEYLDDNEIRALAESGTMGVILPACVFFLGTIPYPPARRMIELGMRVAIATDMNPGSSMTESLPFATTAAAIHCKMTPDELLWAVTYDAARVLGMDAMIGSLESGKAGDVALWNVPDLESLFYHVGDMRAAAVVIGGEVAWEDRDATRRY